MTGQNVGDISTCFGAEVCFEDLVVSDLISKVMMRNDGFQLLCFVVFFLSINSSHLISVLISALPWLQSPSDSIRLTSCIRSSEVSETCSREDSYLTGRLDSIPVFAFGSKYCARLV